MGREPEDHETASRRRYSDVDKVDALLVMESEGGNYWTASQKTGIPHPTLYDWKHGRGIPPDVKERAQAAVERLAGGFQDLAEMLVADALGNKDRIDRANIQQVVTAAAISVEKMRLLREQATTIHQDNSLDDRERLNRVLALLNEEQPALEAHVVGADEVQDQQEGEQEADACPAVEQQDAAQGSRAQQQEQPPASPLAGYYTGRLPND